MDIEIHTSCLVKASMKESSNFQRTASAYTSYPMAAHSGMISLIVRKACVRKNIK